MCGGATLADKGWQAGNTEMPIAGEERPESMWIVESLGEHRAFY